MFREFSKLNGWNEPALVRPLVRRLEQTPDSIRGIERLERFELTAALVIVSSVLNDPELR